MIDIETLGTQHNAVILSIAAVEFDASGAIGRQFYEKIELQSAIDAGLKIDTETLIWWTTQKPIVFKEMFVDALPLKRVLKRFVSWFRENNVYVWANSPSFDLIIIEHALKVCGLKTPWKFYNERCVRTLLSLAPAAKENISKPTDVHNALQDCFFQINYCVEVNKLINNKQ